MLQAFVARPGVRHALWIVGLVMFLVAALALSLTGLGGPHPPTGPGWIAFFGVGLLVTFMGIPIDGGRQRMRFMLDTPFYLMAVAWAGLGPALLSAVLNTLVWSGQAPVVRLLRRHPRGLHWLRLWFAFVGTGAVVVSDEADRIVRRQPRIYRSHVARSLTMALSAGVVVALGRLAGWSVTESGAIGLAAVIVMLSAGSLAVNVASLGVLAGFIPSEQRAEFFGGDHWGRMLRSLPMELVMGAGGLGRRGALRLDRGRRPGGDGLVAGQCGGSAIPNLGTASGAAG